MKDLLMQTFFTILPISCMYLQFIVAYKKFFQGRHDFESNCRSNAISPYVQFFQNLQPLHVANFAYLISSHVQHLKFGQVVQSANLRDAISVQIQNRESATPLKSFYSTYPVFAKHENP